MNEQTVGEPAQITWTDEPLEGEKIVDGRRGVYGDPTLTYIRVAKIISAIIDHEVTAAEAALIQVAVKLVRTAQTPDYSDNSDDIIGYMTMFQEIIGPDMVHAKSVTEYLELKGEQVQDRIRMPRPGVAE